MAFPDDVRVLEWSVRVTAGVARDFTATFPDDWDLTGGMSVWIGGDPDPDPTNFDDATEIVADITGQVATFTITGPVNVRRQTPLRTTLAGVLTTLGFLHVSRQGAPLPDDDFTVRTDPVEISMAVVGAGGGGTGDVTQAELDGAIDDVVALLQAGAPAGVDTFGEVSDELDSLTASLAGKQPTDADLDAIAALSTTPYGRALLTLADAASGRASLGLGTAAVASSGDFQAVDADLTAIAALSTTPFGRAVLGLADAGALRTAAGLGTAATANTGDFDSAGAAAAAQAAAIAASQPLDSDLTAMAALTSTSYGRAFLALADAAAARTALGLGTAATQASTAFDTAGAAAAAQAASQPLDSDLTAVAALATSSFGRGLLTLADAAALRSGAGLILGTDIYSKSSIDTLLTGYKPTSAVEDVAHGGTGASTTSDALTALAAPRQTAAERFSMPTPHSALYRFQRAWVKKSSAAAKVLYVGDSQFAFTFSQRTLSTALSDIANPPNRQLTNWTASGTFFPGDGIWGIGGSLSVLTSVSAGLTQADVIANRGRAGLAIAMANLEEFTLPAIDCTSMTIYWLTPGTPTTQTFDLYIDGVLNTSPSSIAAGSTTITLSAGSHTLRVVSKGDNRFDCIDVAYGNETSGYRPFTAAQSGNKIGDANSYSDFDEALVAIDPHLVVIENFTNYDSTTAAGTMATDLTTLVATIKANCRASIVFALPNPTGNDTGFGLMRANARKVADLTGCFVVDVGDYMPNLSRTAGFEWARSGTTVTVTLPAHNLLTGDSVVVTSSSATTPLPNATYPVTVLSDDTFTIVGVNSGAASGTATVTRSGFTDVDGVHYLAGTGRQLFSMAMMSGLFGGRLSRPRQSVSAADVFLGLNRNERNPFADFTELVTTITADAKIPGLASGVSLGGTAAQASQTAATDNLPGVIRLDTGTTTTGRAGMYLDDFGTVFTLATRMAFYARAKTDVLPNAAGQNNTARLGHLTTLTAAPTAGAFFLLSPSNVNFECVTMHASTATTTDSGIAITANAYRQFTILYDPSERAFFFWIGSTLVAVHPADSDNNNLPVSDVLLPGGLIIASSGTTTKGLSIDLCTAIHPDSRTLLTLVP